MWTAEDRDRYKDDGRRYPSDLTDAGWADVAAVLTRAERARRGRKPEPRTAIMDAQSVASGPQAGERGVDGNGKVKGIKRHVLTCSLGFVLATLVTAANVHDTAAAAELLDRAAAAGWTPERVKVDGISMSVLAWHKPLRPTAARSR